MRQRETTIQRRLLALQDLKYRDFNSKLIPTVHPDAIIGVRMPLLRKLAGEYKNTREAEAFLGRLPHEYFEENNLHGLLLAESKDYEEVIAKTNQFLPYIDNWATCDVFSPKVFTRHLLPLDRQILDWMDSRHLYTVRFAVGMRMRHFLGESFRPEYLEQVSMIRSEEYYINMMIAWFFATALAKQPEAAMPFLKEARLPKWVHNKTIQKSVESYRISPEMKAELRDLRIK